MTKKLTRAKLQTFIAQMPACLIGIEACDSANYWKRVYESDGHTVKMMASQFVKPYVKSNKSDAIDAEAICEAVQHPSMPFVPSKNIEQQDVQSLHRIRSQVVARRTAQANQIRGLLMEYGIIIPKGIAYVRKAIPGILENADNELTGLFRSLLRALYTGARNISPKAMRITSSFKASCITRHISHHS